MFQIDDDRWVHAHDIAAEIPGRDDPADAKESCLAYLGRRAYPSQPRRVTDVRTVLKAQGDLAAIHVLTSARPKSREAELEQRLQLAEKAIDRLLAFVPARAAEIPAARLRELQGIVHRASVSSFPKATRIASQIQVEDDLDSDACHRMVFEIAVPDSEDPSDVVAGIRAVHQIFARSATPEERRAIRLLVEPTTTETV